MVGGQAVKKIRPTSLTQLAIANSVMRLMADGEQPIDIYVKQKIAPQIWYDDMRECGLNSDEIAIVEKYLKEKDGVADSQEVVMQLCMDPHISGFDMANANKLRKIIAKKKFSEIESLHTYYIKCGHALGTSDALLNYVWDKQFKLSFGYSFSTIHTTGYSLIALQEMNLAYHYPIIYWNCACLSVDSSAINAQDFYNLVDDDIIDIDDDGKKAANKMDYAKLAAALDKFRGICDIQLPDINESRLSFTPDAQHNTILYGLKGITRITDPVIEEIMANRPFISLEDFIQHTTTKVVTKDKIINLIKCGAFNRIENTTDIESILKRFIWMICEPKKKLTMQNANMLIDEGLFPQHLEYACEVYKLTKELRKHKDDNKIWYCADRLDIPAGKVAIWRQIFKDSRIVGRELMLNDEPRKVFGIKEWDSYYDIQMGPLKKYIQEHHDVLLERLNQRLFDKEYQKYCDGSNEQWELDSLNFYFNSHPLERIIPEIEKTTSIHIDQLDDIVEGAQEGEFFIKGKVIPKMKLYTIVGTVIDKDKVKGLVTLQCPDGVVNLKLYKDLFATFVAVDEQQDSFFEKGTHLLVTGIQRGATFVPKVYKNLGRKSIMKINLTTDGRFKKLEQKIGLE